MLRKLQLLVQNILALAQGHLQEVRRVGPLPGPQLPVITLQKEFGLEMLQHKGFDAGNILFSLFIHDFSARQELHFYISSYSM